MDTFNHKVGGAYYANEEVTRSLLTLFFSYKLCLCHTQVKLFIYVLGDLEIHNMGETLAVIDVTKECQLLSGISRLRRANILSR